MRRVRFHEPDTGLVGAVLVSAITVATFTMRPNILGELFNVVGIGATVVAAAAAVVLHRGGAPLARGAVPIVLLVAAAETWSVHRSAFTGSLTPDTVRSSVFTVVAILAGAVAIGPQQVTRFLLRLIVGVVIVLSGSQLVTSLLLLAGAIIPPYLTFPVGSYDALVRFPITIDVGEILLGPSNIDRLAGLGREPGWMAMWAAFAWFVWPLVGRPRWWGRVLMLAGVIMPISTAGFGVFVVVLAVQALIRPAGGRGPAFLYARTVVAIVLFAGAAAVAYFAPVVGLGAKSSVNAVSLGERNDATDAGVRALAHLSLGEHDGPGALNLIAAVAEHGWPYSLLVITALLSPLAITRHRLHILPSLLVVVVTLVTAQPIDGSPFPWLVVLALTNLRVEPTEPLVARSPSQRFETVDLPG